MSNRQDLSQRADEIVDFIDKNPSDTGKIGRKAHDVSNEPRLPRGNADGGEWTTGANAPSDEATRAQCPNGHEVVAMEVTAYTSGFESTGKSPGHPKYGITASGANAGPGTIAAPPNYKFNTTRMYVPGYGWGTVQDHGVAIQGNHLDVWFENVEDAKKWARRKLDVIVCKGQQ